MRHAILAVAGLLFAAPLAAQTPGSPADTRPSGPVTGALPIAETSEIGGRNVVPHTANDVSLAGSGRVTSGDPKIRAMAEQRRLDAVKLAELVRRGEKVPPGYAGPLREAIDGDMELWRDESSGEQQDLQGGAPGMAGGCGVDGRRHPGAAPRRAVRGPRHVQPDGALDTKRAPEVAFRGPSFSLGRNAYQAIWKPARAPTSPLSTA